MPSSGTLSRTAIGPATTFQGYDTFTGLGRSTAVEGDIKHHGAQQRCDYTVCESTESLYQALNISVEVAANFRFGGVDAKSEFAASLKTSSTSIVIAIYANKIVGTSQYTSARLKNDIKPPRSPHDVATFYQAYGDSFVSEITTGGEYIATYVFYCQTVEEQMSLMSELRAKGISVHGQVSASFRTAIEQVRSSRQVRSGFSQQIFGFSHLPLPTPEGMVKFALDFATHVPDVPTIVRFATSGYEHVPGMDAGAWSTVRDNRRQFQDRTDRRGVNQQTAALMSLSNRIQWIRDIYDIYNYRGDDELRERRIGLEREMNELRLAIEKVAEDPIKPYKAPSLSCLTWGMPVLNFSGPDAPVSWGGEGGREFWDITREWIMSGLIPRQIRLRGARYVDAITSAFGDQVVKHGGNGGSDAPPLNLGHHEYVTELRGRAAKFVDQLEVVSSAGQKTSTGGTGGTRFNWKVPDGSVFVGFAGRAAAYIDQIRPLIITFKPARWEKPPSK